MIIKILLSILIVITSIILISLLLFFYIVKKINKSKIYKSIKKSMGIDDTSGRPIKDEDLDKYR